MGESKKSKKSSNTISLLDLTEWQKPLRLRIFAGPNGSGKSTVIHSIRNIVENGCLLDFGAYVNADDIAQQLRTDKLDCKAFGIGDFSLDHFFDFAQQSGILSESLRAENLKSILRFQENQVYLIQPEFVEEAAMMLAACLREDLRMQLKRFSFETVFSHPSKIEIIKKASDAGYKVYFYFVGTSSPDINVFRVQSRVNKGGHNVARQKIIDRYYRSMDLLWEAAQHAYRAYFFDNSSDGKDSTLFANFKVVDGKKVWSIVDEAQIPQWFMKYYVQKSSN